MKKEGQGKFIVRNSDKSSIISYHELLYCSADGAYCNIHTTVCDTIQISKTLAVVNQMLNVPFILKVSQSILVNIHHVKQIIYKEKMIVLSTGEKLRFTVPAKVIEKWIVDAYSPVNVTRENSLIPISKPEIPNEST